MLRDVVFRRRRRAHARAMHASSHVGYAWVSISMHACGSVTLVKVLRLAAKKAAAAPLLSITF